MLCLRLRISRSGWLSCGACSPVLEKWYLISSGHDKGQITAIVKKQNKDANMPLISQIAEHDQEDGKTVMEGVLKEVSLWPDEDMPKPTAEVLSKLANVEDFHL